MNNGLFRRLSFLLLLCLCGLTSQQVMAVACSNIFTNGIQAHAANGNINLSYFSSISGGTATLTSRTLSDNSNRAACSGSTCVASGTAALTSTPTFVTGNGANGAVNVVYQGAASIASGNYTAVNVEQEGRLTFSSVGGSYTTGTVTTKYRSILEFQSGDYWINGNLTIGQETQLRRIASSGTTRIFVNGNVSLSFKTSTSGFASNQLLIYATGSITGGNEVNLSAYLYAGGNVSLDFQTIINGGVSGANYIGAGNQITINYQGANLSSADFSPFCTSTPPPVVCPAGISSGITGKYYNNVSLTEPSVASRTDAPIDFNWGGAAPGPVGVNADIFSVRWSGFVRVTQSGNYRFQTVSDDGVRLYVDGTKVIDRWNDHSAATDTTVDIPLVAGQSYSIVLEYYENAGDAVIRLQWRLPGTTAYVAIPGGPTPTLGAGLYECAPLAKPPISSCPTDSKLIAGISGNYFNNQTLTSPATSVRLDGPINFDWASGTPGAPGIGADNFSVSWNGYIYATETGVHRFQTTSDDGVRLTVNGDLLIDQWNDHSPTTHTSATVNLEAGKAYPIKLEFYENGGTAVIQLRWQTPGAAAYVVIPMGVNASPVSAPGLYQCNTIAGYSISHSGTGVTCAGETITFTALDFNGIPITPVNGTNLLLETSSTSSQWVNGNTAGFDGTTNSVTKILRQPVPATVNIDVRDNNSRVELSSKDKDPSIVFTDAALRFSNVQTQVAGIVDNTVTLSAVKTDQVTGACVPQLSGNKSARIAFSCINPASCISTEQLTLNNLVAKSNNANNAVTYNTVTLQFNSSGVASIPLRYTDVGNVQLHAQVDLPSTTSDPAVTLNGSSNPFVVKPYTLKVTSAVQSASPSKINPGTTNSGAGFIPAGEKFNATVQSFNSAGVITPNFGNEISTSERTKIQLQMGCPGRDDENDAACTTRRPEYPVGASAGNLTIEPSSAAVTGGAVLPAMWNEVGSFRLEAGLSGTGYLGAGSVAKVTPSGIIGRFYPDRFNLASSSLTNSCGSFSYMGQFLTLNYSLQALGTAGNLLSNYGPAYGAMPNIAYVTENADAGTNLARFSDGVTKTWSSGVLAVNSSTATFGRSTPNGAPDGPYDSLQVGLQLVDSFDSRNLQGLDMNAITTGICTGSNCTAKRLGGALSVRYGRLRLDDAFGPETASLPVNFITEYWTGNYFAKNVNDNCTTISRNAVTYPSGNISTPANLQIPLTGGSTTGQYSSITPTEIVFSSGNAQHYFSAPTSGGQGAFNVDVDLTSYPWLRFDWNQDGSDSDASLPTARFGFGSYRGHDRVIYWREVFN